MESEVGANPPAYEMFEIDIIGFSPDADTQGRFGINNRGEIAYTRRVGQQYRAMVYLHCDAYGRSAGVHDLADIFRDQLDQLILTGNSYARDIGDQGFVVGQFDGILRGEGRAFAIDLAGTMGLSDDVAVLPNGGDPPPGGCSDWARAVAVSSESDPRVVIEHPGLSLCIQCCDETEVSDCVSTGAIWSDLSGFSVVSSFPASVGCPGGSVLLPSVLAHDAEILEGSSGVLVMAGHAERYLYLDELGECGTDTCGGCPADYFPLRWSQSGIAGLDRPTSVYGAWARGINVNGHAVGYAQVQPVPGGMGTCHRRAVLWSAGTSTPTKLHTGVVGPFADRSRAESINRRSTGIGIVGWNPDDPQPLLWTQQGSSMSNWSGWELQTGSSASYRAVINCPDPNLDCSSNPNVTLHQAFDINDYGWIVAWGVKHGDSTNARFRLYLLIPVDDDACGRGGDINQDGEINLADLLLLLSSWGQCPCSWCPADLTGDGEVNYSDLLAIFPNWGSCSGEPMGLPQSVSDCIERVGLDPVALSACISAIE